MTAEECFDVWAPVDAPWSLWAKPSLFAQLEGLGLGGSLQGGPTQPLDLFWAPDAGGRTAIVVDLPGAESVAWGVGLARRGYRPVPLFNTSFGPAAVVDATPIARELVSGAEALRGVTIRRDAPPAFLLDSGRMMPVVPPAPGKFDNRWVVFPQDFPSGAHLRSTGVSEVLLLHDERGLQEDLAHVLLRWQQLGIRLTAAGRADAGQARELEVKPPSMFRRAWYRALTVAGLRRNNAGGFGAVIPMPSSGGYG
jgi:hypothetical protein